LNRDIDAMRELGVEIRLNTAIGRDVSLDDLQQEFAAVLLAVGAQRSQRLGVPGEVELQGVIPATTFLKDFNLSSETKLEGDVAVVGGGSTALDAARSALHAGARSVHLLYRRSRVEMPAQAEEVRVALAEGIQLQELVAPVQILSSAGHVRGVRCQRMSLSEPGEKGRRKPVPLLGTEFDLPLDSVLVAIGEAPDPSFLPEGTSVGVAPWGGLLINPQSLATGARCPLPVERAADGCSCCDGSPVSPVGATWRLGHQWRYARGSFCPGPLMELIRGMKTLPVGRILAVLSSDPGSAKDIPAWIQKRRSSPRWKGKRFPMICSS
jgi:hypothetical protein